MNRKILLKTLFVFLLIACSEKPTVLTAKKKEALINHLQQMVSADTKTQNYFHQQLKKIPTPILEAKRDSVFNKNCKAIQSIYQNYGFLGNDILGETGTKNFSLIAIHCFNDTKFQAQIIQAMKKEVLAKNASADDFAILVDKQKIHTGQKQIYGTQIAHTPDMWAIPKPLADSLNVNKRRRALDLPPLEDYLNEYMAWHFSLNEAYYTKQGIGQPFKYE